jgi:Flp pilus assembly pilin Flp
MAKAGESTMNNLFLKLHSAAQSFLQRENGQGLTEYALAFTVIALGTVAGQSAIAQQVNHTFIAITSTITTAVLQ